MNSKLLSKVFVSLFVVLCPLSIWAQDVKPVKNVILMITDGTSLSTISLARWYQRMLDPTDQKLNIDPYLSGTILTYCSNAPIGDSAPTTSTFMTGIPSIQGFVATYPFSDGENDLVPLDKSMEYRPLLTLMNASKILKGKKIGLVATSEFPHATPADCVASSYNRGKYEWIVPQMVHNNIDVVVAGGAMLLDRSQISFLESKGYGVFKDDLNSLKNYQGDKMWSLFGPMDVAYDLDAQKGKDPKIDEMTEAALRILDKGENGFMLMVEGSKVDWAAHANDPVGMATEFLAFDRAVKVALDFAKKDGNTVVIVTSDHGNSGLSIGSNLLKNYAGAPLSEVFGPLTDIKKTSIGMEAPIQAADEGKIGEVFMKEAGIELTPHEIEVLSVLRQLKGLKGKEREVVVAKAKELGVSTKESARNTGDYTSLSSYIASIYRDRMKLGFTTGGHTGEETILAVYAPTQEQRLMGVNTNIELYDYMHQLLGMDQSMLDLSKEYYVPHTELFKGMKYEIKGETPNEKVLKVMHKRHTLIVKPFTTIVEVDGKKSELPISTVYSDKTNQMYLPMAVKDYLK